MPKYRFKLVCRERPLRRRWSDEVGGYGYLLCTGPVKVSEHTGKPMESFIDYGGKTRAEARRNLRSAQPGVEVLDA